MAGFACFYVIGSQFLFCLHPFVLPAFLIIFLPKQPAPECFYRVGIVCFVIPSRFVRPFVPAGLSFP
jgi:hypothetical protein